ncbi:MAG: MerR family transcriptional regulator [Pseudolabrys sp.]
MDTKAPDAFRTISEVADELDLPQHVLRFWESRFHEIRPMKRGGGRRYYRPDDIDLLRGIRHLLYGEGYTIRGVQRILREQGVKFVQAVWQEGAAQPPHSAIAEEPVDDFDGDVDGDIEVDERSGGLLGRLPSLLGRDLGERSNVVERREPPMAAAPVPRVEPADRAGHQAPLPAAPAAAPGPRLSRDDLGHLRAALHELGECRKLLDTVIVPPK